MPESRAAEALCPQCGKDLSEVGVSSTVVGSGSSNVVLLSCAACSKVFSAFPGPLIPAGDER
jgi:hypothetical protein